MSLRENAKKVYYGELTEGRHKAILTKATLVMHETDETKDYFRMEFLIDEERPFTKNMFELDFSFFLSHTRKQLGRAEQAIIPTDYLKELIENKTELSLWVSYPIVRTSKGMQKVQNIHFIAPLEKVEDTQTENGVIIS